MPGTEERFTASVMIVREVHHGSEHKVRMASVVSIFVSSSEVHPMSIFQ